jgi:hypothetical protein
VLSAQQEHPLVHPHELESISSEHSKSEERSAAGQGILGYCHVVDVRGRDLGRTGVGANRTYVLPQVEQAPLAPFELHWLMRF